MIAAVFPGHISTQETLAKKCFIVHEVREGACKNEPRHPHKSLSLGDGDDPRTRPSRVNTRRTHKSE